MNAKTHSHALEDRLIETPEGRVFCADDFLVNVLDGERFALFGRLSGRGCIVGVEEFVALRSSEASDTVDGHGSRLTRQFGVDGDTARQVISRLVDSGLLTDVGSYIATTLGAPPADAAPIGNYGTGINLVAIPTVGADRNPVRVIDTFGENARKHGRRLTVLVSAESEDPLHIAEDTDGIVVASLGRRDRRAFVESLVAAIGCDPAVARFGLLGSTTRPTRGANRNYLALLTAGRCSLHLDDDVVGRFYRWPDMNHNLRLLCRGEPRFTKCASVRSESLSMVAATDTDFIALHEEYLGKSASECLRPAGVSRGIQFGPITAAWLRDLGRDPVVRCVSSGLVGDLGVDLPSYKLGLEGVSRQALVSTPDVYARLRLSREGARIALTDTLSPPNTVQPYAFSFDGRAPLAPFPPVTLNEDYGWAMTVSATQPDACMVHLATGVLHDPPARASFSEGAFADTLDLDCLSTWLSALVMVAGRTEGASRTLSHTGRALTELARLSPQDFERFLREALQGICAEQLGGLVRIRQEFGGDPPWWTTDIDSRICALERLYVREHVPCPRDAVHWGMDETNYVGSFQRVAVLHGRLLMEWQALYEVAASSPLITGANQNA